jgi:transcriptional regulator GlxA family with amidase domain
MAKKDVALIIHEGVQALDVAGPLDVFAEANALLPADEGYRCFVVAPHLKPIHASNGLPLGEHLSFAVAASQFHTGLVEGGPALPNAPKDETLSRWLQERAPVAVRYGSICTGAFVLGRAGMLDGKCVTTHWQIAARLAAEFPKARVEHDRIYLRDGALVTSAGVTAGIDLALELVSEDHGASIALACAKQLVVVAQRQGGQSQFSPLLHAHCNPATPIGKVQAYVLEHVSEKFPVEKLAKIAGTSPRTIARLFVNELALTPHDYIEGVRLDQARNLLEATDLALKAVAFDCGFAGPEQMRTAFQRRIGISPQRYRESFRQGNARRQA